MGQKQDALEQIAEDWLHLKGYFTTHNVRFNPAPEDEGYIARDHSVTSDIDIVAFHPNPPPNLPVVYAVTCKSGRGAFSAEELVAAIDNNRRWWGKDAWKHFRELARPIWTRAFMRKMSEIVGADPEDVRRPRAFCYLIVVGNPLGEGSVMLNERFGDAMIRNRIEVKSFASILNEVWQAVNADDARRASSDVGRLLQLMHASGWQPPP